MENQMRQYTDLLGFVLANGEKRPDRTGVGTISVCAPNPMRFDLQKGFPIVGIKKTLWKKAFIELLWFLSGSTSIKPLNDQNVKIWDEWAKDGELGPIYGHQWRKWNAGYYKIDQITNLINALKADPYSRRHLVNAWNVGDLEYMGLPPCHYSFQCYVNSNNELNLQVMLRSSDIFLGLPFNIAQYGLLCHLLANECGYTAGVLTIIFTGDVHLYQNHIQQARQIHQHRVPPMPQIFITKGVGIFDIKIEDITIAGYEHLGFVGGEVAI